MHKIIADSLFNKSIFLNKKISYIVENLTKHKFSVYVVGGAVRDAILGLKPKDFDIVTDATPKEIKKIFKRSRIIGRRFKIVHLFFNRGGDFIEVSTLRRNKDNWDDVKQKVIRVFNKKYPVNTDNYYGKSLSDDVVRRDLTVNSLYYDVEKNTVYDFFDAVSDLKNRKIKFINPNIEESIKVDPIRMVRALRISAKIKFPISKITRKIFIKHRMLLASIPPARMYGELDKILTSKNALETIKSLHLSKLDSMFFSYGNLLENEFAIVCRAFLNVDERAKNNKRVSSSFIFAAALWLVFAKSNFFARAESNPKLFKSKEFYTVTSRVLKKQNNFTSLRIDIRKKIQDIWSLQHLLKDTSNTSKSIVSHKIFRLALNLFILINSPDEDFVNLWVDSYEQHTGKNFWI